MKHSLHRQISDLADYLGADGWVLVRQNRHAVVEFTFTDHAIRQTFACTPSDHRAAVNARAGVRRAARRYAA